MIKLQYLPWMMREAKRKAEKLGKIRNSITGGGGNLAGYLAEIALAKHLEAENVSCNEGKEKHNHDLIKDQKTIEVKTKRRTVDPKEEYEVSIAATSVHQKPDIYAFISITFKEKTGKGRSAIYKGVESIWLCGFIEREKYFEQARYMRKGQIDISNGFRVHANMYNLPIAQLSDTLP